MPYTREPKLSENPRFKEVIRDTNLSESDAHRLDLEHEGIGDTKRMSYWDVRDLANFWKQKNGRNCRFKD